MRNVTECHNFIFDDEEKVLATHQIDVNSQPSVLNSVESYYCVLD